MADDVVSIVRAALNAGADLSRHTLAIAEVLASHDALVKERGRLDSLAAEVPFLRSEVGRLTRLCEVKDPEQISWRSERSLPMADNIFDDVRAALAAATPGPWVAEEDRALEGVFQVSCAGPSTVAADISMESDALAIAVLRNQVPALLASHGALVRERDDSPLCSQCEKGRNSLTQGGNSTCFHCSVCGYIYCDPADIQVEKDQEEPTDGR